MTWGSTVQPLCIADEHKGSLYCTAQALRAADAKKIIVTTMCIRIDASAPKIICNELHTLPDTENVRSSIDEYVHTLMEYDRMWQEVVEGREA